MSIQTKSKAKDRFHSFTGVSFGKISCAQYYVDFYVWEAVLNAMDEIEAIVEIGTFHGGFSRYLAAQAQIRGSIFRTYDVMEPETKVPGFVKLDVFAHADEVLEFLLSCRPFICLCDGGNKARELKTFASALDHDSIIAVHDWGSEVTPPDVPEGLEDAFGDFCDELGSATRFFRRSDG